MKIELEKLVNPSCLTLINNKAETEAGQRDQETQAAFIDGYSTACAELQRYIDDLFRFDKIGTAMLVRDTLKCLKATQTESRKAMIEKLNVAGYWDVEE